MQIVYVPASRVAFDTFRLANMMTGVLTNSTLLVEWGGWSPGPIVVVVAVPRVECSGDNLVRGLQ